MPHQRPNPRLLATGLGAVAFALLAGVSQAAAATPALSTSVAPGGNFDLSHWELQLPTGSPGSPTTISPSKLEGANGFQDSYFHTNSSDGSMTFWDPENGVTTPNSNYARSELREMNADGSAAAWSMPGTHTLSATVKVTKVPNHVCVGQIHLSEGSGSTKPLLELYYYTNGDLKLGIENSPSGGQTQYPVTNVALGTKFSYVIALTGGNTINLTINGATKTWPVPSPFNGYPMYFKAGDYDQSSGSSSSVGAQVQFYALTVKHSS